MPVVGGPNELGRDPNAVAGAEYRAFHDGVYVQLARDLRHRPGRPFVTHDGRARDHAQGADVGQVGDERLRHTVREVLLLGIAGEVRERQDRERSDRAGGGDGSAGARHPRPLVDESRDENGRGGHRHHRNRHRLVPLHEPAGAVGHAVLARRHRPPFEVASDVLRQLLGREVAALGLLPHRLQDDGVEVAGELLARRRGGGGARRRRILLADRPPELVRLVRTDAVGAVSGEQAKEKDAERVDVAGRRDRAAPPLLGTPVLGRHQVGSGGRELGARCGRQDLGDAEIDELRRARRRHQDVARLEVPVHDLLAVRITDGRAYGPEQLQPLPDLELPRLAVRVDRRSVDVLHDEVGKSFLGGAAVEQTGDVGMVQLRQDLALLPEPAHHGAGVRVAPHQLDGDALAVLLVVPLGQVDGAHAAPPDLAQDPVGTDARAGPRLGPALGRRAKQGRAAGGLQELVGLGRGGEERLHLGAQLGVARAGRVNERAPLFRRPIQSRADDPLDLLPALGCHVTPLPTASP